ncbi:unnamed protein product [Closterium sp. Naga37s-1]|nr:unnamed protein product [Closterium sp. Naga37s-1]
MPQAGVSGDVMATAISSSSGRGNGGLSELLTCFCVAVLGALAATLAQFVAETFLYHLLTLLERRLPSLGVRRIIPNVPFRLTHFTRQNFLAVFVSHLPLFLLVGFLREGIVARAELVFPPRVLPTWALAWGIMVAHDAWFFWTHSLMHVNKTLYRALHAMHHRTTTDLGVFSTSNADPFEFLLDWSAFYMLFVLLLHSLPSWRPLELALALIPVGMVNTMGHCAYHLPALVFVPLSYGILLTPGAQRPTTHFLHHLDPRYNRSLYFTWWDQMVGTFKDGDEEFRARKCRHDGRKGVAGCVGVCFERKATVPSDSGKQGFP